MRALIFAIIFSLSAGIAPVNEFSNLAKAIKESFVTTFDKMVENMKEAREDVDEELEVEEASLGAIGIAAKKIGKNVVEVANNVLEKAKKGDSEKSTRKNIREIGKEMSKAFSNAKDSISERFPSKEKKGTKAFLEINERMQKIISTIGENAVKAGKAMREEATNIEKHKKETN